MARGLDLQGLKKIVELRDAMRLLRPANQALAGCPGAAGRPEVIVEITMSAKVWLVGAGPGVPSC